MTAKTTARRIYLCAFDDFAIGIEEAAKSGKCSTKEARDHLRHMERLGLIASTHVNGEKALTYQCWETYDDADREQAKKTFNEKYAEKAERSSAGTPRSDTAAHQKGNHRVVYVNADGKVTARGERTRGTKAQCAKIAKTRNASKGPRETGSWTVQPVARNAR